MKASIAYSRIETQIASLMALLKRFALPVVKAFTFNIGGSVLAPRSALCLSLEPGRLSIAWGKRRFSRIRIKLTRAYPVEEGAFPTPEQLASDLALFLAQEAVKPAEIVLAVPKAWTVFRVADMPATVKENLSAVVSYELDRLTPFTPDQAFYDFTIGGENGDKVVLFVSAVRADLVNPYLEASGEEAARIDRVTIASSAVATLSRYLLRAADLVFVRATGDGYEGGSVLGSNLVDVFSGTFDTGDEQGRIDRIAAELNSRVGTGRVNGHPSRVLLDGLVGGEAALGRRLAVPVSTFDAAGDKMGLKGRSTFYGAIGGLVESLWPKAKGPNLLSRGVHPSTRKPVALTIVLLLAMAGIAVFYTMAPLQIERRRLVEIDRQIQLRMKEVKKVEALKKEVDAVAAQIATIERFKTDKPMVLAILKELTTTLPTTAWLTRANIGEAKVETEGYASAATELLAKLEASKYLKKVEFASPTFRDVRLNADRFVIKMEMEGQKDAKAE